MDRIGVVAKKEIEKGIEGGKRGGRWMVGAGGAGGGAVATLRKFEKALALRRAHSFSQPTRSACSLRQQLPYRFLPAFAPHLVVVGRQVAKLALARYLTKNGAGPLPIFSQNGLQLKDVE